MRRVNLEQRAEFQNRILTLEEAQQTLSGKLLIDGQIEEDNRQQVEEL